jgi:hypothetical protein
MVDSMSATGRQRATWHDYYEMCKPNVVFLMLLTSVIGMFMAVPGMVPWEVLLYGNLGIGLCAASAAAINHLVDQKIDCVPGGLRGYLYFVSQESHTAKHRDWRIGWRSASPARLDGGYQ